MSVTVQAKVDEHAHDDHGHHHHKETFVTKYIFSTDHKMIAKQYLITGVLVMGFIGIFVLMANNYFMTIHLYSKIAIGNILSLTMFN